MKWFVLLLIVVPIFGGTAELSRPNIVLIIADDLGTQIGTYFEIAHLLGIPLLADNNEKLSEIQMRVDQDLAVLPQRIRKGPAEVIDDF